MLNSIKNSKSKIQNSSPVTRHSCCAAIPLPTNPANPVLLSKIHPPSKIQNFSSFLLHPSNKCAQIAKEWLDKGLAKCHQITVSSSSSRNPPAWIGRIHGISFFTPNGTPPSSSAPNASTNSDFNPESKIHHFFLHTFLRLLLRKILRTRPLHRLRSGISLQSRAPEAEEESSPKTRCGKIQG